MHVSGLRGGQAAGKVVGGGFSGADDEVTIFESKPKGINEWAVFAAHGASTTKTVIAYAICMTTEPTGAITTAKVKVAKKKGR